MLNLQCAVLVTKANDKSSPLTPHLAEVPKFTASSAPRGEGGGFQVPVVWLSCLTSEPT